jgi:glycerophosphoryl diester phosphodiesterase
VGSSLKYFYFKQHSGYLARTNYSINETTADVLIFGASTANHQYYPDVFEKQLNLSYYNVGRDGTSILYHYALLSAILKRYTPKIIILDIRRELAVKPDGYDRLSMLLPYYDEHPEMDAIIRIKSPYEKFKLLSKIYPYNSLLFAIWAGNSNLFDVRNSDIKGYLPLTRVWAEPPQTISVPILNKLDTTKIKVFESFIQTCIKAKIRLYIVISPNFFKMNYIDVADKKAGEIAQKYNVKFLNYSQDSLFLANAKYFADIHHLNSNGAMVFSRIIADRIIEDEKSSSLNKN